MNPKILVVDDDPENLEVVIDLLSDKSEEIYYASSGVKALELARETQPDVILMDWQMPGLSGIETIRELKKETLTATIPIIVTTGVMLSSVHLKEALESGAVDFLPKPLDPIVLNARIRSNLRIREQHETITRLLEQEKLMITQDLNRKERELTSAALILHEYNVLLNKLIDQCDLLLNSSGSEQVREIKNIKRMLKGQLKIDRSWENFRRHFEEVHPDFFNRLYSKHQKLTPNDKKICAYLKIGLDNKEIALITNVVPGSIRKSLNRLKKKINLGPSDNLREYISHF